MEEIEIVEQVVPVKLPNGQRFEIDLVEAVVKIHAIMSEATGDGYDYIDAFAQWVTELTGVAMKRSWADSLMTRVNAVYAQQKKSECEAIGNSSRSATAPVPGSPASTASAPSP